MQINAAFAVFGTLKDVGTGAFYSEQAKRLPKQEVTENKRQSLMEYVDAAQGLGHVKRQLSPVSLVSEESTRNINQDTWVFERF
ncbi:MAG: hypothetical protein WA782_12870 [Sulfitobacter sp.]